MLQDYGFIIARCIISPSGSILFFTASIGSCISSYFSCISLLFWISGIIYSKTRLTWCGKIYGTDWQPLLGALGWSLKEARRLNQLQLLLRSNHPWTSFWHVKWGLSFFPGPVLLHISLDSTYESRSLKAEHNWLYLNYTVNHLFAFTEFLR